MDLSFDLLLLEQRDFLEFELFSTWQPIAALAGNFLVFWSIVCLVAKRKDLLRSLRSSPSHPFDCPWRWRPRIHVYSKSRWGQPFRAQPKSQHPHLQSQERVTLHPYPYPYPYPCLHFLLCALCLKTRPFAPLTMLNQFVHLLACFDLSSYSTPPLNRLLITRFQQRQKSPLPRHPSSLIRSDSLR